MVNTKTTNMASEESKGKENVIAETHAAMDDLRRQN